jgi:hypothetical protein
MYCKLQHGIKSEEYLQEKEVGQVIECVSQRGTFEVLLHTYNTLFNIQCNKLCWNTITHSIKFSNLMVERSSLGCLNA